MDDAVRTRDAAREALADVEPPALAEALDDRLADAPMTPGALALLCARAVDSGGDADALAERAAGVQLIYEGLRLTRSLAHEEPWANDFGSDGDGRADPETDGDGNATPRLDADIDADLDIVAADVLVARGFYILARTEAAKQAVETVRRFGRDQTLRRGDGVDRVAFDRSLEADVFELAVVAGADVGGDGPSVALREYAAGLVREFDPDERDLPPAASALPEAVADRIAALSTGTDADAGEDRVPSSATDR